MFADFSISAITAWLSEIVCAENQREHWLPVRVHPQAALAIYIVFLT